MREAVKSLADEAGTGPLPLRKSGLALFDLQGRRALVTGSSRGIGRAIALAFAMQGAVVAVHGARREAEAQAVAAEAREAGHDAAAFTADLSDPESVARLASSVASRLGGVDILVLNASVQAREAWDVTTTQQFDAQVAVNLKAALDLIAAFVPGMRERGWGRVLAIGSVQQVKPHPDMLVYAATKAAQVNMMKNLARQLAPLGITCNNLAPGVIATDRNADALADDAYNAAVLSRIPSGAFGAPADCVGAALLLCSEAGRYITGADLLVDGGMHL